MQTRAVTARRKALAALVAASLTTAVSACGSSRPPHGGEGVVTAAGAIGPLRIDRSTPVQIQAFVGPADYIGAGALHPLIHEFASFIAFGYDCTHVASGGIPTTSVDPKTSAPGDSHIVCRTVYFVSQRTGKLTGFNTNSPRFHTASGVRPGASVADAKQREHGWYVSDVPPALNEKTASAWLSLDEAAGSRSVAELTLESRHNLIGLQFV